MYLAQFNQDQIPNASGTWRVTLAQSLIRVPALPWISLGLSVLICKVGVVTGTGHRLVAITK
jgi:hypothetical protein